jgi:alpha-L-rhamnosidase
MIVQPEFPGWVNWLKRGATTLWEDWKGVNSRNHIMFGDISAWMRQYLAGITPDPENPGFKHFFIRPNPVSGLEWARAGHEAPAGMIVSSWRKSGDSFELGVEVPQNTSADIVMPDGAKHRAGPGKHNFVCPLRG